MGQEKNRKPAYLPTGSLELSEWMKERTDVCKSSVSWMKKKTLKILTVLVHANASTGLPLTFQLESCCCSDTSVFSFETQSNCEKHFPVALKRVVVILKLWEWTKVDNCYGPGPFDYSQLCFPTVSSLIIPSMYLSLLFSSVCLCGLSAYHPCNFVSGSHVPCSTSPLRFLALLYYFCMVMVKQSFLKH